MALSDFYASTEHRESLAVSVKPVSFTGTTSFARPTMFSPKSPAFAGVEEPVMAKQPSFSFDLAGAPLHESMLSSMPSLFAAEEQQIPMPFDEAEDEALGLKERDGEGAYFAEPDDVHHSIPFPPEVEMSEEFQFELSPESMLDPVQASVFEFHQSAAVAPVAPAPPTTRVTAKPSSPAAVAELTVTVPPAASPATVPAKRKRGRPPGSKNKPKPKSAPPKPKKPRVRFVSAADLGVGKEDEFVEVPMTSTSNRRSRPIFVPGMPLSPTAPAEKKPKKQKLPKTVQGKDLATTVAMFLVAAHESGVDITTLAQQINGYSAELAQSVQTSFSSVAPSS